MAKENFKKIVVDEKICEICELPKEKGKNGDVCACILLEGLAPCELIMN